MSDHSTDEDRQLFVNSVLAGRGTYDLMLTHAVSGCGLPMPAEACYRMSVPTGTTFADAAAEIFRRKGVTV